MIIGHITGSQGTAGLRTQFGETRAECTGSALLAISTIMDTRTHNVLMEL